jgi:hypothetical protein
MSNMLPWLCCVITAVSGYFWGLRQGALQGYQLKPLDSQKGEAASLEGSSRSRLEDSALHATAPSEALHTDPFSRRKVLLANCHSNNPITRMEAFVELAKNLDEEAIQAITKAYEEDGMGSEVTQMLTLELLTFAWAKKDPRAALAWAEKSGKSLEGELAIRSILHSWAEYDPAQALVWARESDAARDPKSKHGSELLLGVISGLAESDFATASTLMAETSDDYLARDAVRILLPKIWKRGESSAIAWAQKLPAGPGRDAACREIGKQIAKSDLGRAMAWVDQMAESKVKADLAYDFAKQMASNQPADAVRWVKQMPAGETRSRSIQAIVSEWAEKDPVSTAQWLNTELETRSGESLDDALTLFVHKVTNDDLESALKWVAAIADPKQRDRLTRQLQSKIERSASGSP